MPRAARKPLEGERPRDERRGVPQRGESEIRGVLEEAEDPAKPREPVRSVKERGVRLDVASAVT